MIYYNLCGIESQHSNISKGKRGGGRHTYKIKNKTKQIGSGSLLTIN
jgi:hypothetical protein